MSQKSQRNFRHKKKGLGDNSVLLSALVPVTQSLRWLPDELLYPRMELLGTHRSQPASDLFVVLERDEGRNRDELEITLQGLNLHFFEI
jgi:hypothetical protein